MPAHYVHLSGKNVDDAILKIYGLKEQEEGKKKELPKTCIRCGTVNGSEQDCCTKCGLALSLEAAMKADEKEKDMIKTLEKLEADAERKNREIKEIKELLEKGLGGFGSSSSSSSSSLSSSEK
jgi:integrase/recombinase XerD